MSGKARHYEHPYRSMVYGSNHEHRDSDEIAELGKTAVKGVVTVGVVGVTASLMGGILGGFKP